MLILTPSKGPEDWRDLLPDRDKQWKDGRSAKLMAETWESSHPTLPAEISATLSGTPLSSFEAILAIPEYQVPLPGGNRPSQNDLFLLGQVDDDLAVIMVEGKVDEPFGPTVAEWSEDTSEGKQRRLEYLTGLLHLHGDVPGELRYQLLHRTASAIIEARRFHAKYAVMLVHSFSNEHAWFDDFATFVKLLGGVPENGGSGKVPGHTDPELWVGWAHGKADYATAAS